MNINKFIAFNLACLATFCPFTFFVRADDGVISRLNAFQSKNVDNYYDAIFSTLENNVKYSMDIRTLDIPSNYELEYNTYGVSLSGMSKYIDNKLALDKYFCSNKKDILVKMYNKLYDSSEYSEMYWIENINKHNMVRSRVFVELYGTRSAFDAIYKHKSKDFHFVSVKCENIDGNICKNAIELLDTKYVPLDVRYELYTHLYNLSTPKEAVYKLPSNEKNFYGPVYIPSTTFYNERKIETRKILYFFLTPDNYYVFDIFSRYPQKTKSDFDFWEFAESNFSHISITRAYSAENPDDIIEYSSYCISNSEEIINVCDYYYKMFINISTYYSVSILSSDDPVHVYSGMKLRRINPEKYINELNECLNQTDPSKRSSPNSTKPVNFCNIM